jgi:transposase-like protein
LNTSDLQQLLEDLRGLSAEECLEVKAVLRIREQQVQSSLVMREAENAIKACPHCDCADIAKAGCKDGRQRFRCKACCKTFNALTGTPLARLRKAEKHIENGQCMVEGLSVRKTARHLGVSVPTAFLWRHRFLQAQREVQPEQLSGVVEVDETFFLESFKGQRQGIPRPSKTRGTPAKKAGLSFEQIPVLVARDRSSSATLTAVLPSRKAKDIGARLLPILSTDSLLCSDGASAYRIIAKTKGIKVKSTPAKPPAGIYHINNVNAYDSRLKGWMFRFQGVATKYLPNYLGWHRMLDKVNASPSGKAMVAASLAPR